MFSTGTKISRAGGWGTKRLRPAPLAPRLSPSRPAPLAYRERMDDTGDVPEPDVGEEVTRLDPRIRVLPEPTEVFAPDDAWLATLLHPLVSVDLSALDPTWAGWVHLVSPVEPEEGYLGEGSEHAHDAHASTNWISLRLTDAGQYRFEGQREFFLREAGEGAAEEWADLYEEAEHEYQGTRDRWAATGQLTFGDEQDRSRPRPGWGTDIALLDQLGGEAEFGNWANVSPPPGFVLDVSGPAPSLRTRDGAPLRFIAGTAGYPWRDRGADMILAFYEPVSRTVLLTFDWG